MTILTCSTKLNLVINDKLESSNMSTDESKEEDKSRSATISIQNIGRKRYIPRKKIPDQCLRILYQKFRFIMF